MLEADEGIPLPVLVVDDAPPVPPSPLPLPFLPLLTATGDDGDDTIRALFRR